jgi:hypothetical protein
MSPNLTAEIARSHTRDLQAYAAREHLARLATRCCASAARRATGMVAAAGRRTMHWLRAGQLQAPCTC